jgi:methyl-accepting chemotaxis protein
MLRDVNETVTQIDLMTQQNAAMVEESTAASRSLAQQAGNLSALVAHFNTAGGQSPRPPAPSAEIAVLARRPSWNAKKRWSARCRHPRRATSP